MPIRELSEELISDIEASYGPLLHDLNLAQNELVVLERLERLPALTRLDVSGNVLVDVRNVAHLPHLTSLDLSHNCLTCLSGLESLSALEVLHVDHNQLSDPQALLTLTHSLPSLTQLSVVGNPLCPPMDQASSTPQWEHWVASLPPHLHTINGVSRVQSVGPASPVLAPVPSRSPLPPTPPPPPPLPSPSWPAIVRPSSAPPSAPALCRPLPSAAASASAVEGAVEGEGTRPFSAPLGWDKDTQAWTPLQHSTPQPQDGPQPEEQRRSLEGSPGTGAWGGREGPLTTHRDTAHSPVTPSSVGRLSLQGGVGRELLSPRLNNGRESGNGPSRLSPLAPVLGLPPTSSPLSFTGPGTGEGYVELVEAEAAALRRVVELQEEAMSRAAGRQGLGADTAGLLLRRWREEVVKLLVQQQADHRAGKRDRAQAEARERQLEGQVEEAHTLAHAAHTKAQATALQLEQCRVECSELREQLHQAKAINTSLQAQHMHDTKALHTMASAVQHAHHSLQHAHRQGEASLCEALSELQSHGSRLAALRDRLCLLQHSLQLKDLTLRNSMAALEADKRYWRMALAKAAKQSQLSQQEGAMALGGEAEGEGGGLLPLRPECEAVMRAVFRRLDSNGTGTVDPQRLLTGLRTDPAVGRLMQRWVGHRQWSQALDSMGQAVTQAHSLTWGEFLLLFIPDTTHSIRTGKAARPYVGGEQEEEEEEEEALALQLVMPPSGTDTDKEGERERQQWVQGLSMEQLGREVRRLGRERAFLMRLVRTEAEARTQWMAGLRGKWGAELKGLRERVRQLEGRVEEERRGRDEAEARWQGRLREVEGRHVVSERERQHSAQEWQDKANRLSIEASTVRKELGRAMVSLRAMEREVQRAKEQGKRREEEGQEEVERLREAMEELRAELAQARRERNEALHSIKHMHQHPPTHTSPHRPPPQPSPTRPHNGATQAQQQEDAQAVKPSSPPSSPQPSQPQASMERQGGGASLQAPGSGGGQWGEGRAVGGSHDSSGGDGLLRRLDSLEALTHHLLSEDDDDEASPL